MIANTKGGYNDLKYPTKHNYKSTKEHRLWISMLKRCMLGGECPICGASINEPVQHTVMIYKLELN